MSWLRKASRSEKSGRQNRKNHQSWRRRHSKLDPINLGPERLEDRALLSITAETGMTISPVENTAFSGPVATFTSPDNGPFTAVIQWGDGNSTTVSDSSISGGPSPATFTVNGTHTYADEMAVTNLVTTISDTSDAATAAATGSATVGEGDTLTAAGSVATFTATQGAALSTTLATFTDTDTGGTASDFTATIDWGDGSTGTGVVSSTSPGSLSVSGSHVYAATGAHQATVALSDDAPGTATATATAMVNVSAVPAGAPDLTITKTGPSSANVGGLVTYSVKIANSGGDATNVEFDDTYSAANLTIVSVNTGGDAFSVSNGDVSGSLGLMPRGTSDTITIVAIPTRQGTATNAITFAVPGGNAGMVTTTNSTTINAAPASAADVSINKTAPAAAVAVGDKLTTTVTLKNNAATPVTNVAFVDSFPGQAYFSASDTNGTSFFNGLAFTFNMGTGDLTGTVASIAAGATDTITIVTVPTTVNATADTATIGISGGNQAPNTASAVAMLSLPASAPDITVTKSGPTTAVLDTPVTDTIKLTNSAS
ncbi:MAG: hypothetical protein ACREHD_25525, partial [Pirellulales bacterium]